MASSPKKDNVEPAAVTPEGDDALMDRDNDAQGQGHGEYGYAAEVKEQDRWLPIANGASISPALSFSMIRARTPTFCTSTDCYHTASRP